MADEELVFTNAGMTDEDCTIYQVEDGTIFSHYLCDQTLYVTSGGRNIGKQGRTSEMEGELIVLGTHENALYFKNQGKYYRAEYGEADGVSIHALRTKLPGERIICGTLCCTRIGQKEYVHHIGEDPVSCGVLVDVREELLLGLMLKGLHRKKIIYMTPITDDNSVHPVMSDLSKNAIVLELGIDSGKSTLWTYDSSAHLYITTHESRVFIVDVNQKKCLQAAPYRNDLHPVGFYNGFMTAETFSLDLDYSFIVKAELLKEKFDKSAFYNRLRSVEENIVQSGSNSDSKDKMIAALQETINKTNAQLNQARFQIEKLRQENERLNNHNREVEISTAEVFEENKELKQRIQKMTDALKKSEGNEQIARNADIVATKELVKLTFIESDASEQAAPISTARTSYSNAFATRSLQSNVHVNAQHNSSQAARSSTQEPFMRRINARPREQPMSWSRNPMPSHSTNNLAETPSGFPAGSPESFAQQSPRSSANPKHGRGRGHRGSKP